MGHRVGLMPPNTQKCINWFCVTWLLNYKTIWFEPYFDFCAWGTFNSCRIKYCFISNHSISKQLNIIWYLQVIQNRYRHNARVNFNTTWEAYKNGFGDVYQNYWLGTSKLSFKHCSNMYNCYISYTLWFAYFSGN